MREFRSVKAYQWARALANDGRNQIVDTCAVNSFLSADLLLENLRLARHLVMRGSLAGGGDEFTFHAGLESYSGSIGDKLFVERRPGIPHFCNDCAHQGNHTPAQMKAGRKWTR